MITIEGVRCEGLNAAHNNLQTQLPLIAEEFPEVAECYHGTINVELPVPLIVVAPDHRSKPIYWDNANFPHGEVFDLLRIEFEAPLDAAPVTAWLYIPHGSPARRTPWIAGPEDPMDPRSPGDAVRHPSRSAVQVKDQS
jgi:hypothetical protein